MATYADLLGQPGEIGDRPRFVLLFVAQAPMGRSISDERFSLPCQQGRARLPRWLLPVKLTTGLGAAPGFKFTLA